MPFILMQTVQFKTAQGAKGAVAQSIFCRCIANSPVWIKNKIVIQLSMNKFIGLHYSVLNVLDFVCNIVVFLLLKSVYFIANL